MHRSALPLVAACLLVAGCSSPAAQSCTGTLTVFRGMVPGIHTALEASGPLPGVRQAYSVPPTGVAVSGVAWPPGYEDAVVLQMVRSFLPPRPVDDKVVADYSDGGIWLRFEGGEVTVGATMPARLTHSQRLAAAQQALEELAGLSHEASQRQAPIVVAAAQTQSASIGGPTSRLASPPTEANASGSPLRLEPPLRPRAFADPGQWEYTSCEAGFCQVASGLLTMDIAFPERTLAWSSGTLQAALEADALDRVQVRIASPGHDLSGAWKALNMTLAAAGLPAGEAPADEAAWHGVRHLANEDVSYALNGTPLIDGQGACP